MIDTEAVQHEVQQAFQKMERAQRSRWGSSEPLVSELLDHYGNTALELLDSGDYDEALALLTAFLEPFLEQWMDFVEQDECDFNTFAHNLASSLLGATLTPAQRTSWLKQIPLWQAELDDFGGGELDSVQEILRNADADLSTLAQEDRHTTQLRLDHLEGLRRFEESLALAKATGLVSRQASLLAQLDRFEELEALIRIDPSSVYGEARSALVERVAQTDKACALRLGTLLLHAPSDDDEEEEPDAEGDVETEEEPQEAIRRDGRNSRRRMRGFEDAHSLPGLAGSVIRLAESLGDQEALIQGHQALVRAEPSLKAWKQLVKLAGPQDALLQQLSRASYVPAGTVEILLAHEHWADAWRAAQRCYAKGVLAKTADIVAAQLPTEVGEYSRNMIEDAIGDSVSVRRSRRGDPYPTAAEWLARLRVTELALGQGARWNTLLLELRQKHARKHTLMPSLNALALAPEGEAPPETPAIPVERKPLIFKVD